MDAGLPRTFIAALALVLASACNRPAALPRDAAEFGFLPARGEDAPGVELVARDGTRLALSSLRGQVVFVNFWASWCPPCREEMPSMMALGAELASRHPGRFTMLAVSVDEGWASIERFFAEPPFRGTSAPLTLALDRKDQATTAAFYCAARGGCPGEYKLPETYVVDPQGRLVAYVVGPRDWSDPRPRAYLEHLLR